MQKSSGSRHRMGMEELGPAQTRQVDLPEVMDTFVHVLVFFPQSAGLMPVAPGSKNGMGLSTEGARTENETLKRQLDHFAWSGEMASMRSTRQKLPAWAERHSVVDAIDQNQVVIITGMPGCGKSTQVQEMKSHLGVGTSSQWILSCDWFLGPPIHFGKGSGP